MWCVRADNQAYGHNSPIPPVVAPHIYPEPHPSQYQHTTTETPKSVPEIYVAPPQIIRVIKTHARHQRQRTISHPIRNISPLSSNQLISTFRII